MTRDRSGANLNDNRQEKKSEKQTGFDRLDLLILFIIVAFSLALRIYGLSFPVKVYFDETHYVPAARTYLTDEKDPNYIHPPLGKEIMAVFMKIYGDYSIGWRAGSVAFGVLMIVVMYLLGIAIFKNRIAAVIASSLLGIEFLHIVQSRIATLDIYIAFFIFLGYYFIWLFVDSSQAFTFEKGAKTSFIYLILSGISFGLATSVKLAGLGGALGAYLFLVITTLVKNKVKSKNFFEYLKNVFFPDQLFYLVIITVIFFSAMSITYFLTHIPHFLKGGDMEYLLYRRTFKFHYTDKFTHPYLSQMWQWPTVHRPIWYLWEKEEKTQLIRGIIAMGCLLFWWSFIPILLDLIYRAFKEKDKKVIFILCGYLPLYLFWLSSLSKYGGYWHFKGGFFYYMLPCVPFMVLGITETLEDLRDTLIGKISIGVYLLGLIVFLAAYFPILAGTPISQKYYEHLMKLDLFKSWI